MGVEPHVDDEAVLTVRTAGTGPGAEPPARRRPDVSGDLPTVFAAAPMFRRVIAGYDRFQVDSYVQWAEEELATGDRERDALTTRYLHAEAALVQARELLAHSSGGAEFLRASRRIGTMLATAADEADSLRSEAEADRRRAAAELDQAAADAQQLTVQATTRAELTTAAAASEAAGLIAEARRFVAEAEEIRSQARAEAEAGLARIRGLELAAMQDADRVRARAAERAAAARTQARAEVVGMLASAREERRRADTEAAGTRERLDADAIDRRAGLLAQAALLSAEVAHLERRRAALQSETAAADEALAVARRGRHRRRLAPLRLTALRRVP